MTSDETWNAHDNWLAAGQFVARENGTELNVDTSISLIDSIPPRSIEHAKNLFSETDVDRPHQLFAFIEKLFAAEPGRSTEFVAEAIFNASKVFEPGKHPEPANLKLLLEGCASLDKVYWELYQKVMPDLGTGKVQSMIDNLNKLLGSLSAKPGHVEGNSHFIK